MPFTLAMNIKAHGIGENLGIVIGCPDFPITSRLARKLPPAML
jgi:hypothetical protein